MTNASHLIISTTADQTGFGKGFKVVKGLTDAERHAALDGCPVFYRTSRLSGGRYGTYWRLVKCGGGCFFPRVPGAQHLAMLASQTGLA